MIFILACENPFMAEILGRGEKKKEPVTVHIDSPVDAQAPLITGITGGGNYSRNSSVTLTIGASSADGGVLSYQWYSSSTNSTSGGTPVGSGSSSYSPSTSDYGTNYYYVIATNTNSTVDGNTTAIAASNVVSVAVVSVTVDNGAATNHFNDLQSAIVSVNSHNTSYIITVYENQILEGTSINTFASFSNINITLKSGGFPVTIAIDNNTTGSLFRIGTDQTFILDDDNITLQGRTGNNNAVVYIREGNFIMNGGKITGNENNNSNYSYSGGVDIVGTFTMKGGEISGNESGYGGGGVSVSQGSFYMEGGIIRDNKAMSYGGGVAIWDACNFIKTGGIVYGDDADPADQNIVTDFFENATYSSGHAVYTDGTNYQRNDTMWANDVIYILDNIVTIP